MSRSLSLFVVQCRVGKVQTSLPEERRLNRSFWPGAGSLSFFYPLNNNTDKGLPALTGAFTIYHLKEPPLAHPEQK